MINWLTKKFVIDRMTSGADWVNGLSKRNTIPTPTTRQYGTDIPYYYLEHVHHKTKQIRSALLGIDVRHSLSFQMRNEAPVHRFFKRTRINVELQSGEQEFDRRVYVESDCSVLGKALRERAELRQAIIEMFDIAARYQFKVVLHAAGGVMWMCIESTVAFGGTDRESFRDFRIKAGPRLLRRIAEHTMDLVVTDNGIKAKVSRIEMISGIPFAIGIGYFALGGSSGSELIGSGQHDLIVTSVHFGLTLSALAIAGVMRWVGKSSRTHVAILMLASVAPIGFTALLMASAVVVNVAADSSKPETHFAKLDGTGCIPGETVTVESWRNPDEFYRLRVDADSPYIHGSRVSHVTVTTHGGALGFEWLASVHCKYDASARWGESL